MRQLELKTKNYADQSKSTASLTGLGTFPVHSNQVEVSVTVKIQTIWSLVLVKQGFPMLVLEI